MVKIGKFNIDGMTKSDDLSRNNYYVLATTTKYRLILFFFTLL